MSEPMSSAEIEDVLSSIRRLISDEGRHPAARDAATDALPGKLLLTPALRVVPDAQSATDLPHVSAELRFASNLRDRVTAIGAAAGARDDWEADAEDREAADVPEAAFWAEAEEWAEPETAEFVTFPDAEHPVQAGATDHILATAKTHDPEADGMVFVHARRAMPAAKPDPLPPEAKADIHDPRERILAEFKSRREAGAAFADEPAATRVQAPVVHFAHTAHVAQAVHAPDAADDEDTPADDVAAIEDRLQAMVRALILEELQGDLGERITRNIRKLVRAEVARALAARDLD